MNTISVEEMRSSYDWQHAFHEACFGYYKPWSEENNIGPVKYVNQVICADEGENDGKDWIAVVGWSGVEGLFAVMRAGCDYTGWDCRAGGKIEFYNTIEEALSPLTLTVEERLRFNICN